MALTWQLAPQTEVPPSLRQAVGGQEILRALQPSPEVVCGDDP